MALIDLTCDACGATFEEIVPSGVASVACRCGATARKVWTFRGHVSETKHLTKGEEYLAVKHARDLERHAANGTLVSLKISGRDPGPKPDIPRRIY